MYYPESYHKFYSYDKDGNAYEWNNSGHGCADAYCIVGDWINDPFDDYIGEEWEYDRFYPQSFEKPEAIIISILVSKIEVEWTCNIAKSIDTDFGMLELDKRREELRNFLSNEGNADRMKEFFEKKYKDCVLADNNCATIMSAEGLWERPHSIDLPLRYNFVIDYNGDIKTRDDLDEVEETIQSIENDLKQWFCNIEFPIVYRRAEKPVEVDYFCT